MIDKDWTGNRTSTFTTLGASSHSKGEREINDYYATDPKTIIPLLMKESISTDVIWEPACGEGHLSDELISRGYKVLSTDLIDREYEKFDGIHDFLTGKEPTNFVGDILTNPPYKYAQQFVEKSLDIVKTGSKVIMFLKLQFLEGQKRNTMFKKNPPKKVYVFSKRQSCAKNGDFDRYPSSAVAYAWFVWEKGFIGNPEIEWI